MQRLQHKLLLRSPLTSGQVYEGRASNWRHWVTWQPQAGACLQTLLQSLVQRRDPTNHPIHEKFIKYKITAKLFATACAASPSPCSVGDVDLSVPVPCSCLYTGRIRQAKECDNDAKSCESPSKARAVTPGQAAPHPLFLSAVPAQHRGSSAHCHYGTATTSFQVEKWITLSRGWHVWKSFLHTSNRQVVLCVTFLPLPKSPWSPEGSQEPWSFPGQPVPPALLLLPASPNKRALVKLYLK